MPCGKRQQGDVPGLLDGAGQAALVRGANAGEPPGHDLAALGHKALQQPDIAVRDRVDLLGAELADLLAAEELAAAAGSAGGPSAGAAAGPAAGAGPGPELGPGLGPGPDSWGAADAPVSGAFACESLQTWCFLFTLFASGSAMQGAAEALDRAAAGCPSNGDRQRQFVTSAQALA